MLSSIGNHKSKRFASMGDLVNLNANDPGAADAQGGGGGGKGGGGGRRGSDGGGHGGGVSGSMLPQRRPKSLMPMGGGSVDDAQIGRSSSPAGGRRDS